MHKVAQISVWKSLPVIVADFAKRAWQGTLIFANCPVTLSSSVSLRCQGDPLCTGICSLDSDKFCMKLGSVTENRKNSNVALGVFVELEQWLEI